MLKQRNIQKEIFKDIIKYPTLITGTIMFCEIVFKQKNRKNRYDQQQPDQFFSPKIEERIAIYLKARNALITQ